MILFTTLALALAFQEPQWSESAGASGTHLRHLSATDAEVHVRRREDRTGLDLQFAEAEDIPGAVTVRVVDTLGMPVGGREVHWIQEHPDVVDTLFERAGSTNAQGILVLDGALARLRDLGADEPNVNLLDYRNRRLGLASGRAGQLSWFETGWRNAGLDIHWFDELPTPGEVITLTVESGPLLVLDMASGILGSAPELQTFNLLIDAEPGPAHHMTWDPRQGPLVWTSPQVATELEVQLFAPGLAGWKRTIDLFGIESKTGVARMELPAAFLRDTILPIHGRALNEDGSAFAEGELRVELYPRGIQTIAGPAATTRTDHEGRFTAHMVAIPGVIDFGVWRLPMHNSGAGIFSFAGSHPRWRAAEARMSGAIPDIAEGVDLDVLQLESSSSQRVLNGTVELRGTIVDPQGVPVGGAQIDGRFVGNAESDSDGRYLLRTVEAHLSKSEPVTISHRFHASLLLERLEDLRGGRITMQPTGVLALGLRRPQLGLSESDLVLLVDGEVRATGYELARPTTFIEGLEPGARTVALGFRQADSPTEDPRDAVADLLTWDLEILGGREHDLGAIDLHDLLRVSRFRVLREGRTPSPLPVLSLVRLDTGEVLYDVGLNEHGVVSLMVVDGWGRVGLKEPDGTVTAIPDGSFDHPWRGRDPPLELASGD